MKENLEEMYLIIQIIVNKKLSKKLIKLKLQKR